MFFAKKLPDLMGEEKDVQCINRVISGAYKFLRTLSRNADVDDRASQMMV